MNEFETRQFWEGKTDKLKEIDKVDIILWLKKRIKAIKLSKPNK